MVQVSIFTIRGPIGKNTLKVRLNSLKITFYFHKHDKEADELFKSILTPATLQAIVQLIPLEWLQWKILRNLQLFVKSTINFSD
jgi:hypothetical protein